MMNKAISIGSAAFFGILAMGLVLKLGSETLAVVAGILLGVMGVIPLGVLILAAVNSGREEVRRQPPPVVIIPPGTGSLPMGNLYDPYRQIPQPTALPLPGGMRQFRLIGGPDDAP